MTKRVRFRTVSSGKLRHLANMRAAKARKRQERMAAGWSPEPKFRRAFRLEITIRDTRSGESVTEPLRSVRQALRMVAVLAREWSVPTPRQFIFLAGQ